MPHVEIPLKKYPSQLPLKGKNWTIKPITDVNWFEAVEFCQRLSANSGRTYRLPTEAEWEYACRAGTTSPFYFGKTITGKLANYNSEDKYFQEHRVKSRREITSVGIFPPNGFGLYDMHGNVREWCLDHWHDRYQGAPNNGSAWLSGDKNANRVLRGGSWISYPRDCRSATRYYVTPDYRNISIGFRVVCEIPKT